MPHRRSLVNGQVSEQRRDLVEPSSARQGDQAGQGYKMQLQKPSITWSDGLLAMLNVETHCVTTS